MSNALKTEHHYSIIAYLTFIGLIISIIINLDKKSKIIALHCRQMLGLIIMLLISNLTEKYINSYVGTVLWAITFIMWCYSLYFAATNKHKLIPVIGKKFQLWFYNIVN